MRCPLLARWPLESPNSKIHQVLSKPLPLQHPSPPRPCIVLALPSCSLLRLERPPSLHRRATTGTTQTRLVTHATLLLKRGRRHPGEALTYIYMVFLLRAPWSVSRVPARGQPRWVALAGCFTCHGGTPAPCIFEHLRISAYAMNFLD